MKWKLTDKYSIGRIRGINIPNQQWKEKLHKVSKDMENLNNTINQQTQNTPIAIEYTFLTRETFSKTDHPVDHKTVSINVKGLKGLNTQSIFSVHIRD